MGTSQKQETEEPCVLVIDVGYADYYDQLLRELHPHIDVIAASTPTDDDLERPESPYKAVIYVPTEGENGFETVETLKRLRRQRPNAKLVLFAGEACQEETKALADITCDRLDLENLKNVIKLACAL